MRIHNSLPNYNAMYQEKGKRIKENTTSQRFEEEMEKAAKTQEVEETKDAERAKEESKSDTEIITRADGSKVLMITNQIGGMETVTSIKISGPNPFRNDDKELPDFSDKAGVVD